jgi:hypothetical protein
MQNRTRAATWLVTARRLVGSADRRASAPLRHAVLTALLAVCWACDGGGAGPDQQPEPERHPIVFTVSPLRLEDLALIVPLGSLNPPAHTIPNDHIAFNYVDRCPCDLSPRPVYAPAGGTVRLILRGQDDGIEIGQPPHVAGSENQPWYYMGHVLLRPDIQVGQMITAGEQIGTTSPYAIGVDLGLVDITRVTNNFIVPQRYHAKALHGDKPLLHFEAPLRATLYSRVQRISPDKDGRFDYDVAGRLAGGWFHESLPRDNRSTGPEGWTRNLAFVWWEQDPTVAVVSVGGTVLPALVYWIDDDDPAFGDVSSASGVVRYHLHIARPQPGTSPRPDYILLVQLVADDQLRVEAFPGTSPAVFTANAKLYLR